jgi:hypothetical protein
MVVKYRDPKRWPWPKDPNAIDFSILSAYDYIFVWGDNPMIARNLIGIGYTPIFHRSMSGLYQKAGFVVTSGMGSSNSSIR